jgi:hypothetical protein
VQPANPPIKPSPERLNEAPTGASPGTESEPVLPPGREVPWRDMTGCFVGYLLITVEIIGLPLGVVFGLLTGEWRWLIPWAVVAVTVFVLGRLNLIPIIYR